MEKHESRYLIENLGKIKDSLDGCDYNQAYFILGKLYQEMVLLNKDAKS